jgi:hypothetical protein
VRTLSLIGLAGTLLIGCNETYLVIDNDSVPGIDAGTVTGRVCDPSGRTWLPDAVAYTHLYDADGSIYDTRIAYSDRDGYWYMDELPGEREYTFYVQYGDTIVDQQTVWVGDGEAIRFDEPDCFDPLQLDVAVVTGDYDDFQLVLNNMGFANYQLIDGLTEGEITDFLSDADAMAQFDIIFFNGGHVEDNVIYVTEDEETGETPDSTATDLAMANIRAYVEGGGSIYASDWAYDVVELGWPDRIDFVGDDSLTDAAQLGEYDLINAAVSDQSMARFLDANYIEVQYDLPVWPPIQSISESVSVHLTGSIEYKVGANAYTLSAVPLMVSFTAGEGKVAFSTFRVAKNASTDMIMVLQYMMYNL